MTGVPSNIILPYFGMDFDASGASGGNVAMPFKALLIGQKTTSGTITANTLQQVFGTDQVDLFCAKNSMLSLMAKKWFAQTKVVDTFIIALADAGTGTAATRVITFTGPATARGQIALEHNGQRIVVAVADGDTATNIGDAFVAELANYNVGFTAVNSSGEVTCTAVNKGVAGGESLGDMRYNTEPTDQLPTGVGVSIAAVTPGTNDPDIQDAIDAIGDNKFNVIVNPYADDTNLDLLETYLETQFLASYMRDGLCYQAMRGDVSTQTTFSTGANRNCPHAVLIDCQNRRCATWELAAAYAGAVAASAQDDPGNPLHRIKLQGIKPNLSSERWLFTERNTLARNGIATLTDENGVQTESTVTMYLKNSAGAVDTAYQYQNTLFIGGYARWDFVNTINTKYPRARLADSALGFDPGIAVMTPAIGKMEAVSWFSKMQRKGLFEDIEQFKEELVVQRSEDNVNRLEWLVSPNFVNQFIVGSGVIAFRL